MSVRHHSEQRLSDSPPRSSSAFLLRSAPCLGWSSHRLRKTFHSSATAFLRPATPLQFSSHQSTSATVRFLSVHSRYRSIRGFAYAAPYHAKANHCLTVPLHIKSLHIKSSPLLCFSRLHSAFAVLCYTMPLPCSASRCLGCAALFWAVLSLCSSCSSLPLPVGAHLSCSTAVLLIAFPSPFSSPQHLATPLHLFLNLFPDEPALPG